MFGSILISETRLFQAIFETVSLTPYQWLLCLAPGVLLLVGGEVYKAFLRLRTRGETRNPVAAV